MAPNIRNRVLINGMYFIDVTNTTTADQTISYAEAYTYAEKCATSTEWNQPKVEPVKQKTRLKKHRNWEPRGNF